MDIKILLQVLNQQWMILPSYADGLSIAAHRIFSGQSATLEEKPVKEFCYSIDKSGKRIGSIADAVENGVGVINLRGSVMKYDYCGSPGTKSMMNAIAQANDNPGIKAILLQIDSPGGSVSGTQELANAIKASTKPVVVFADGMMCSAAMWIGSAAAFRVASADTAIIGSIGTMAQWADYKGYYEKAGIKVHEVYASESTDKNLPFREAEGNNKEGKPNYTPLIKTWLDPTNSLFMKNIQENLPAVDEAALHGATYVAADAIAVGLIDTIGTFEDAVNKALELANKTETQFLNTTKTDSMKWKNFLAMIGFTTAVQSASEIKLEDAHADLLETAITGQATLEASVTALTTERDTLAATVSTMQATIDANKVTIDALNAEVLTLKKSDAGTATVTTTAADAADQVDANAVNAIDMSFQKELMEKL